MSKIYGITLVPRRLYNIILATLLAFVINTFCIETIGKNNLDQKINDKYGSQNIECVVEAVYHEARGEPQDGWKAVIEVILNRSNMSEYPNSLCEVVHQNKQFSYRNGDKKNNLQYNEPKKLYEITKTVYEHLYNIDVHPKHKILPDCVSHYDGKSFKKPSWANKMIMVKEIAGHQFYCKKNNYNNNKKS